MKKDYGDCGYVKYISPLDFKNETAYDMQFENSFQPNYFKGDENVTKVTFSQFVSKEFDALITAHINSLTEEDKSKMNYNYPSGNDILMCLNTTTKLIKSISTADAFTLGVISFFHKAYKNSVKNVGTTANNSGIPRSQFKPRKEPVIENGVMMTPYTLTEWFEKCTRRKVIRARTGNKNGSDYFLYKDQWPTAVITLLDDNKPAEIREYFPYLKLDDTIGKLVSTIISTIMLNASVKFISPIYTLTFAKRQGEVYIKTIFKPQE
ncbi:hypothetical protein QTN25_004179 [Entamoeba marina]